MPELPVNRVGKDSDFRNFSKNPVYFSKKALIFFALAGPTSAESSSTVAARTFSTVRKWRSRVLDGLVTDPFDLFQFAVDKGLAAFLPVEGNGETVHLFLDVRQKVEQGRSGTDADQYGRESAEQLGGAVSVVLGQSGDGGMSIPSSLQHLVQ